MNDASFKICNLDRVGVQIKRFESSRKVRSPTEIIQSSLPPSKQKILKFFDTKNLPNHLINIILTGTFQNLKIELEKIMTYGLNEFKSILEDADFEKINFQFSLMTAMEFKSIRPNLMQSIIFEIDEKQNPTEMIETYETLAQDDSILEEISVEVKTEFGIVGQSEIALKNLFLKFCDEDCPTEAVIFRALMKKSKGTGVK